MGIYHSKPLFELGRTLATAGAAALGLDLANYLHRHRCGDWGEGLGTEDKQANEVALLVGERILSCYQIGDDVRIYVITEWNRSYTTVMLPEEY